MAFDPPIQRLMEAGAAAGPPPAPATLQERREQADATLVLASLGPEVGVQTTDHRVPVDGGEISVRVLAPEGIERPAPVLFFIHGGGWFQGNLDTAEVECGPLASLTPCVVVSVAYRLAPEHPFPTPLEDCIAAYQWLLDHLDQLGGDRDRIAIAGTSAGANLAVALCLAARDRGLPMPIFQLLDAPCLDLTLASPSMDEYSAASGLNKAAVDEYAGFYAGDTARTHPLISPLHADDLSGLPPAFIVVAEHDPVRDDGERYLTRLHAAGVPGAAVRVLGHFHGGWIIPITATHRLISDIRAAALRRAFAGDLVP